MTGDAQWLKEQIEKYDAERGTYEDYAAKLKEVLTEARARLAPEGIVQARAKSLASFAEKAMRKKDKYQDPVHQLTDLAGARIVVLTEEEAERLCAFIRGNFLIDQANSEDRARHLAASEFGYRGIHFVVQVSPQHMQFFGVDMPLFDGRKAEIQVHTALQNAWAAIGHDRIYKSLFTVPEKFVRDGARVAAMLEASDRDFGSLIGGLDRYALNYGVSLSLDSVLRELIDLSVLRVTDKNPENLAGYALRQAQLAKVLGSWDLVIRFLKEVTLEGVLDSLADRVRVELGQAYCRTSEPASAQFQSGQKLLADVARPGEALDPPGSVGQRARELRGRAAAALAHCARLGPGCQYDPIVLYRLAMQCEPANPYHLASFLEFEMERLGHAEYAELMRPGLLAAVRTCRDHAEVRIEFSRPYFAAGRLLLFVGEPAKYQGLAEYARGVRVCLDPQACIAPEVLDEESRVLAPDSKARRAMPPEAEYVERLLAIARALKWDENRHCAECVKQFDAIAGRPAGVEEQKRADDLRKALATVKTQAGAGVKWVFWPEDVGARADAIRGRIRAASEALKPLASKGMPKIDPQRPVLIVAGGADPSVTHRMGHYRDHILQALLTFKGTICSGATEQGIPGLVGDVVCQVRTQGNRCQHLIGYLPKVLRSEGPDAKEATEDKRYDERIATQGTAFTPLEPLQNWTDIIVAGVDPAKVRLLGINGGPIAKTEYCLALALGAMVGVVESSGRAVAELLPELLPWERQNLLVLPEDPMAVRAFVMVGQVPPVLKGDRQEKAAKAVHEAFLAEGRYKKGDEVMMPWEYLRDDLQQSNRDQVAYWIQILNAVCYDVQEVPQPLEAQIFREDEADIELMARMEHGRWIVERLRAGWRYGPVRDTKKKISPSLVPWEDLPDKKGKDYDLEAVRKIPIYLGKACLEVVPMAGKPAKQKNCT